METLNRCNEKMVTLAKWVREWMENEKENCETQLYSDFRNLLGFIGVVLDEIDLLFLEEKLGFLGQTDLKDLQKDVNWAFKTYKDLL